MIIFPGELIDASSPSLFLWISDDPLPSAFPLLSWFNPTSKTFCLAFPVYHTPLSKRPFKMNSLRCLPWRKSHFLISDGFPIGCLPVCMSCLSACLSFFLSACQPDIFCNVIQLMWCVNSRDITANLVSMDSCLECYDACSQKNPLVFYIHLLWVLWTSFLF